eukprot:6954834-Heterocapsa_arctica.AAC.1
MEKKAINFFATVAVKKFVYVDDMMTPVDSENMAYVSALELFMEYGNDHLATIFDRLLERFNKHRTVQYSLLSEINCRTQANIIQSILGLGHISRQQQHSELLDMPDI